MVERAKKKARRDSDGLQSYSEINSKKAGENEDKQTPKIGVIGVDYTAEEYLKQRKIRCKRDGNNLTTRCPSCDGGRDILVMNNDLGNFTCNRCSKSGSFSSFRKLIGDTPVVSVSAPTALQFELHIPPFSPLGYHPDYIKRIKKSPEAKRFFKRIGIGPDLISRLKIGLTESGAYTWPFMYTRKKNSISYLTLFDGKNSWVKLDGDPRVCSWFGQQVFKLGRDTAYICQTPMDAAVLLALGESNVLAPPQDNELPRLRTHQVSLLERCSLVYLVPNPTHEGQQWAARLQMEIGQWRTRVVQMDYRPAEIIEKNLEEHWEESKRKSVSSIGAKTRNAKEMIPELDFAYENKDTLSGIKTELEPLDELLGGWRPGEVTVLSGEPGVGKSTFCAFISLLQASEGIPCLHFTFEVSPFSIMKKWISMLAGDAFVNLDRHSYVVSRKKLARRPLYIPQTYGICEMPEVRRVIYDSCTRHGVKFLVLDHLGFLSMLGQDASNDVKTTGTIMREIKRWSLDLRIHILLVHHLRKKTQGQRASAGLSELRGSGEVGQLADNVMILRRSAGSNDTMLSLRKVRDDSGSEGNVKLSFNRDSLVYLP